MKQLTNEILKELYKYSVSELCDGEGIYNSMDYHIKQMVTKEKIIGPALTVKIPIGEGDIIVNALEQVLCGEIIVIAGQGNCKSSYWGGYRSFCAKFKGAKGVIIDGAFRDIDECETIGFPIYARAITPGTAIKSGEGKINVPVSCGGVIVNPGDIIVGDRNGVCVISPNLLEEVIKNAKRKKEAQNFTINEMKRTGKVMPRIKFNEYK